MQYQFRPLTRWPGKQKTKWHQKDSRFKLGFQANLNQLEKEIDHLRGKNVVIQADVSESDIRLDGMLRASAKPRSSGIILSFDSKHGPLSYPCDTFKHWHDNLRAITLTLESLRRVDRYGVTKRSEQYTGWKQIPETTGFTGFKSKEEAAEFMASGSSYSTTMVLTGGPAVWSKIYRAKAKVFHPDVHSDGAEIMSRLNAARDMLNEQHHNN